MSVFFHSYNEGMENFFLVKLATEILAFAKIKLEKLPDPKENQPGTSPEVNIPNQELGPLAYVVGSVISTIYRKAAFGKVQHTVWKEQVKSLCLNKLCSSMGNASLSGVDRGGLWISSKKLVGLKGNTEIKFFR